MAFVLKMDVGAWSDALQSALQSFDDNKTTTVAISVASGVVLLSGVYFLVRSRKRTARSKPQIAEIAAGHIDRAQVRKAFVDYRSANPLISKLLIFALAILMARKPVPEFWRRTRPQDW